MTDSTLKNLSPISGATPAGLQAADLLYAVRPGSPDADFKATGGDIATLAAAAAPVQSVAGRTGAVTLSTADVSGLASGTSGGILYYSASGTLASSAQLDANAVIVGGGAGAAPVKTPVTVDPSTGAIAGFAAAFNNQSGTAYTLAPSDAGKTVTLNNAGAVTVTLPNSLPAGFTCECIQLGAGQVTFSAASGATLNNRQSQTKIAGQHGAARLAVTANSGGTAAIYNLAGDTA